MKTIAVSTDLGPRMLQAYTHGKFAVHLDNVPTLAGARPDQSWVVSHIATGMWITCCYGRPRARKLAKALDGAVAADITPADVEARSAAWRAFVTAIRPLVRGGAQS